ncbi:MAG: hypothetical protein ABIG44_12555 [Planctomycetota bacterium]
MRTLCAIVVSSALALAVAPVAGDTYYFTAAVDSSWHNEDNWKDACTSGGDGQVPTSTDNAVICEGKLCTISTADAECLGLTVQADADLTVGTSKTLQIGANSTITGDLSFASDGELHIAGSLTLSGGDSIPFAAGGEIEFQGDYNLVLANGTTLSGGFLMNRSSGSYTFVNNGKVEATEGLDVTFRNGTIQSGGQGAYPTVFKVSHADSTMEFDSTCTVSNMGGDFEVTAGTLRIETDTCTTGDLTFSGGKIQVTANKVFQAGGTCN